MPTATGILRLALDLFMVPAAIAYQNQVKIEITVPLQHPTIGADESHQVLARLQATVMQHIRSSQLQPLQKMALQIRLGRRTMERGVLRAVIYHRDLRFR